MNFLFPNYIFLLSLIFVVVTMHLYCCGKKENIYTFNFTDVFEKFK